MQMKLKMKKKVEKKVGQKKPEENLANLRVNRNKFGIYIPMYKCVCLFIIEQNTSVKPVQKNANIKWRTRQ